MKQVFLKRLILINWKGVKHLDINFSRITNILGANATGKSRTYDSFLWGISGKDQFDRKDFEIISIEDGKVLERVDAEVQLFFDINGEETVLKRVFRQVWQRKRGENKERMTKHETLYYCNDVPKSAAEYKNIVNSIIDETLFKLITNPAYFLGMHWTEQREYLFQMAGTISDERIAASDPKFRNLLDSISGKSFEEHRRVVNARKKKLEEDLDEISPRIDQTRKLMPEKQDFPALKIELKEVEEKVTDIDTSISDASKAIRTQYEDIQKKEGEINSLRTKQQTIVQDAKEKAQNAAFDQNSKRRDLEDSLATAKRNLSSAQTAQTDAQQQVTSIEGKIKNTEKKMEELRTTWSTENATAYNSQEGCLICPVFNVNCGDPSVVGKHEEGKKKAQKAFDTKKQENLKKINEEGVALKKSVDQFKEDLETKKKDLATAKSNVETLEAEVKTKQDQLDKTPIVQPVTIIPEELEDWKKVEENIAKIQKTITEVKPVDNTELSEQKKKLEARRDEIKGLLGDETLIKKYTDEIDSLEKESAELSQQIADLEKDVFLMDDFSKVKIKECEQRVNNLFRIVNFQLFDTTIENKDNDEKAFEVCIAKNKSGVPISTTNTAEKVNAGLDIINALCRFHNVAAPIFIDCRESVNELIDTESQIINLIVLQPQYKCNSCEHIRHTKEACPADGCGCVEFTDITPKGLIIQ